MRKNNKGITLVALIITIIILLILTGVTTKIILDSKFLDNAKSTVAKANNETENQITLENNTYDSWDEYPGQIIKGDSGIPIPEPKVIIELYGSTSNITTNSCRISATGTHNLNDTLTYSLKFETTAYDEKTGDDIYWDITGLTQNTKYKFEITATDTKENSTTIEGYVTTLPEEVQVNNAPMFVKNRLQDRQTNSLTIVTRATDADGDNLTYELYLKGNSTVQETKTAAQNTDVTFTLTGLEEYTTYTWYIIASDASLSTESSDASARTYCSGTGFTCNATLCTVNRQEVDNYCGETVSITELSGGNAVPSVNCPFCGESGTDGKCKAYYSKHLNGSTHELWIWDCQEKGWMIDSGESLGSNFNIWSGKCMYVEGTSYDYSSECTTHKLYDEHYYCTKHSYVGTSSTHTYCSHGKIDKHY